MSFTRTKSSSPMTTNVADKRSKLRSAMMILLHVSHLILSGIILSLTPSRSHNGDSASHLTTVFGPLLVSLYKDSRKLGLLEGVLQTVDEPQKALRRASEQSFRPQLVAACSEIVVLKWC